MSRARGLAELATGYDSGSSLNFRNRIINGDMRIDQRNAGAAVTASGAFPVDRFVTTNSTDGAFSFQQDSSAPTGFVNSIKYTTTTADASLASTQIMTVQQRIEGTNVADLAFGTANAKTVTLSFWVRSSLTGTFGGSLTNGATDRGYPFTYSISAADTFEYKTVEIEGDTSGTWLTTTGIGLRVFFSLGAGTDRVGTAGAWAGGTLVGATGETSVIGTLNATWYITGVQLEVGSVATPFERRPFGTELSLCQRYCVKSFNQGIAVATNTGSFLGGVWFGQVAGASTAQSVQGVRFPVTMRATPSVTIYNPDASNNEIRRVAGSDWSSTTLAAVGESSFGIFATSPAGSNVGDAAAYHYLATAEL